MADGCGGTALLNLARPPRRATSRTPQISQAHPVTQPCGALRPDRLLIVPLAAAATIGAPWRSRRKTI
jgi:hypothetical protein